MKAHKNLIIGIAFLLFQAIVLIVKGMPDLESGSYGIGYLLGYLAPGVIGIVLMVIYFIKKR